MFWFSITISAYFLFAVCALIDKYLLTGPIPHPKVYAFYVGLIGVFVLFLVPFVDFYVPQINQILLSFSAGIVFVLALYYLYKSLHLFEASRMVPAIGGLCPLFTFGLVYVFSSGREILSFSEVAAFVLLVSGSVLITYKKEVLVTFKVFEYSAFTAFLFSLSFVLAKYVYLSQPFWNGYIWIRIGGFLAAFAFLLSSPEAREKIFKRESSALAFFLFNKGIGAGANILQNWAIALAPLSYVAMINALQGTEYVFILILAFLISFKYPRILKEEISKAVIFQKIIALLFIGFGLFILFLL
jgi:hypothetical protein